MYLKEKDIKISGSKAELIDRVFSPARGTLGVTDAVQDEECPNRPLALRGYVFNASLKDVRANCFCASFTAHTNSHATSCMSARAKSENKQI